jgi:hypothetical protein
VTINQPSKLPSLVVSFYSSNLANFRVLAPIKIKGLNSKTKKEEGQRINHENMLLLNRLIKGKPTFSVNKWQKEERNRQKLLKNFGLYPYILNKREDEQDMKSVFHSTNAPWQSSTKLQDPNMTQSNFPVNITSVMSSKGDMLNQTINSDIGRLQMESAPTNMTIDFFN